MSEMERIGCIGCGNMGAALLEGFAERAEHLTLFGQTRTRANLAPLEAKGVHACETAEELTAKSDLIILAVKPHQISMVLESIRNALNKDKIVLSVAAGITLRRLQEGVFGTCPVVRCMPNTPAVVGKGIFAFSFSQDVPAAAKTAILRYFSLLGLSVEMSEEKITAFSALIGAGPAFVLTMIQGMVQAGITLGFTEQQSREMVYMLFEGTSLWGQKQDLHPMALRDKVSSPAGLTIAGVNSLERNAFSGLVTEAVLASFTRALQMENTHVRSCKDEDVKSKKR